jgi:hypothetical protein
VLMLVMGCDLTGVERLSRSDHIVHTVCMYILVPLDSHDFP